MKVRILHGSCKKHDVRQVMMHVGVLARTWEGVDSARGGPLLPFLFPKIQGGARVHAVRVKDRTRTLHMHGTVPGTALGMHD